MDAEVIHVLSNADTGYSDESMRFGTKREMYEYMDDHEGIQFFYRREFC